MVPLNVLLAKFKPNATTQKTDYIIREVVAPNGYA